MTDTYHEFTDDCIVICPTCWERPDGALMERYDFDPLPLLPDVSAGVMSYTPMSRITAFTFKPCGHEFKRLSYVVKETPESWGLDRPELISVWFVDDYLGERA